MENTQVNTDKQYKTPIYTRKASKAYIDRLKDKDIEAFNKRNAEYMQKRINKIKEEGKYEEFKQDKKEYMKRYREKAKQKQNPERKIIIEEIEIIN